MSNYIFVDTSLNPNVSEADCDLHPVDIIDLNRRNCFVEE